MMSTVLNSSESHFSDEAKGTGEWKKAMKEKQDVFMKNTRVLVNLHLVKEPVGFQQVYQTKYKEGEFWISIMVG